MHLPVDVVLPSPLPLTGSLLDDRQRAHRRARRRRWPGSRRTTLIILWFAGPRTSGVAETAVMAGAVVSMTVSGPGRDGAGEVAVAGVAEAGRACSAAAASDADGERRCRSVPSGFDRRARRDAVHRGRHAARRARAIRSAVPARQRDRCASPASITGAAIALNTGAAFATAVDTLRRARRCRRSLPACDAVMAQEPAETIVIVAPLSPPDVHAPDAVNVTGFPEAPPVALTVNGGSP